MSRNDMRAVIVELQQAINEGGGAAYFLAESYLSFYRRGYPVELYGFVNLDAPNRDLFHRMMDLRHIQGWSDSELHQMFLFCEEYVNSLKLSD